jgi:cytochrome c biogenesis protein CcmG/thiol:disulfide interchange protein DsbE
MRRPARTSAIVMSCILVPVFVLLATQIGNDEGTAASRRIGKPVPAFDLPVLDSDDTVSSSELIGTTYLVNFWNDWCIPCQQEHPALAAFDAAHAGDDSVRLIGIVRDENSLADIRAYVADEGVAWTVLLDPDQTAKLRFGTTGQPETFAVSAGGVVRAVHIGPATLDDLENLLAAARTPEAAAP